jgi:hypothetical protein
VILPKEIRRGANALDVRVLLVFAGREAAKMRPSEDRCCKNGRYACTPIDPRPGRPEPDILGRGVVGRQRKLAV